MESGDIVVRIIDNDRVLGLYLTTYHNMDHNRFIERDGCRLIGKAFFFSLVYSKDGSIKSFTSYALDNVNHELANQEESLKAIGLIEGLVEYLPEFKLATNRYHNKVRQYKLNRILNEN